MIKSRHHRHLRRRLGVLSRGPFPAKVTHRVSLASQDQVKNRINSHRAGSIACRFLDYPLCKDGTLQCGACSSKLY